LVIRFIYFFIYLFIYVFLKKIHRFPRLVSLLAVVSTPLMLVTEFVEGGSFICLFVVCLFICLFIYLVIYLVLYFIYVFIYYLFVTYLGNLHDLLISGVDLPWTSRFLITAGIAYGKKKHQTNK
jgi:hypothetical protein